MPCFPATSTVCQANLRVPRLRNNREVQLMEREHDNDRIKRLLDVAVAASTYTIRDTRITFEQVRQLAPFDRSMRRWIRVEVPQPETADLAEALGRVLDRFTDPDTGRIGFAPHDLIGGPVTGMTIDLLATGMVTAAAILGTDRVVSAVLSWAEGNPGSYVYTWVLRGVDVPKRVELREGIRFEKLPEGSADLLEHIEDWSRVGIDELAGQPVLRYDLSVDPMFYRLKTDDDADKIRRTAVKGPQPPDLNLRYLLDALSLVCRSNVQCVYEMERVLRRNAAAHRRFHRPLYAQRAPVPLPCERLDDAHPGTPRRSRNRHGTARTVGTIWRWP